MLTIWGRNTSSNVQTVMWAVAELGLEHERVDWGGAFGGNDAPDYRAMNPNGLIPVMRDGDTVLWESPVIVRYLGARYGDEAFWPSDPCHARRAGHVGRVDQDLHRARADLQGVLASCAHTRGPAGHGRGECRARTRWRS